MTDRTPSAIELRSTDRVILVYSHKITLAEAEQIRQKWLTKASDMQPPMIISGADAVLVQRGVEVDIEHGEPSGPELLRIHVPLDPALIATRSPGLIERILDDARVGIEDAFKRWPQ